MGTKAEDSTSDAVGVTLADMLIARSRDRPDDAAIVSPRRELTYSEFIAQAARSARELRERGIGAGCNVGVALRDTGDALVSMLSLWMLDAVAVPLDFREKPRERGRLAEEFRLAAILEDRPGADASHASILIDENWDVTIARHEGAPLFVERKSSPALISLTSGTTGRPAGLILGHQQLAFRIASNLELGGRRPHGRLLSIIPMSSSGARNHALSALFGGTTIHTFPSLFSIGELIETIRARAITTVGIVPTILRGMIEAASNRKDRLLPGLDSLYCFGAPILPAEKRRARASLSEHFVEGYSSSLTGRISVLYGEDVDRRSESVGRVLPHVTLEIVDDRDRPVEACRSGTIRVRSPGMAQALWSETPRDGGDRLKDGWAYPGDIGALDAEGFLHLHGRASDLIIRGGTNVHPAEIERVLSGHASIKDSAVVGYPSPREGEEIAAFVVTTGGVTESDLSAYCRARLTPDKRPRRFILVSSLPRNANGKIARGDLRERLKAPD